MVQVTRIDSYNKNDQLYMFFVCVAYLMSGPVVAWHINVVSLLVHVPVLTHVRFGLHCKYYNQVHFTKTSLVVFSFIFGALSCNNMLKIEI